MKTGLLMAVLGVLGSIGLTGAAEPAPASVSLKIDAQPLNTALNEFGKQSGLQVVFLAVTGRGVTAPAVVGRYSPEDALQRLLANTSLAYEFLDERTVAVREGNTISGVEGVKDDTALRMVQGEAPALAAQGEGKSADVESGKSIEEIIVTAQKRSERLQDVPVPVAVVSAQSLAENNQPRLRDYFASVPGLNVSPTGAAGGGQQVVAIRGISSGNFGNPTVGITVDDVPYGAFTREFAPDIDPGTLDHVEVLRGPQGTLYGSSSMGGLIKFVTVDPSTDGVFGQVQADVHSVQNGAQGGYGVRGSINLPISDSWAMGASAFTRQDPGYIDDPVLSIDGINQAQVSGGRLSALFRPTDSFSLKLSALYQHAEGDGASDVTVLAGLGDLQQSYVRGAGAYEQTVQAYSAIVNADVGVVDFTSITGYNVNDATNWSDFSFAFGQPTNVFSDTTTEKFTQELRASGPLGNRIEYLLGGFYTHENIPFRQNAYAVNASTSVPTSTLLAINIPIEHTEIATFLNLTFELTERFDVQVGGRLSRLKENFGVATQGSATGPAIQSEEDVFTYLLTPRFRISPDLMVYARAASGYRPGRSNSFNPDPNIPRASSPDRTRTYEIGAKGAILDHQRLSFDASLYYIDWEDIQISLVSPLNRLNYFTNGSRAKSAGAELSIQARPTEGFVIAAWGAYSEAELTEAFPTGSSAFGQIRSRLPFGARYSGSLSVDQEFPLSSSATGFVGATASYVGDRVGVFIGTPARAQYPDFTKVDLRAGVRFDEWTLNLYANNVADERGLLGGGAGALPPYAFNYVQPRTYGVSILWRF